MVNYTRRIESIISDLEALNSFKFKSGDNHFSEHEEPMQLHLNLNFIKTYADSLEDAENNLLKCLNSATQSKIDIATGNNGLAVHIVQEVKKVTWTELVKGDTVAVLILETLFTKFNSVSSSTFKGVRKQSHQVNSEAKRDDLALKINSRLEILRQMGQEKITEQLLRDQLKNWIEILQNHLTKVELV